MMHAAFEMFIWFCIYVIPFSVITVLLCICWAPVNNSQTSSMDSDYYGHGWNCVDHDGRRRRNAEGIPREADTDSGHGSPTKEGDGDVV